MKKLTVLALAAALSAASVSAHAADISVDGEYLFQFQSGEEGFHGGNNDYAQQRVRLGLAATVSENLSGYFQTESVWNWGTNSDDPENPNGTAFDGAKVDVKLRQAYIDWKVPNTDVKIRMGRHAFDMPAYASTSPIIADMVGDGIAAEIPVNDTYTFTAFWTRMARGSANGFTTDTRRSKEFDLYGLVGDAKFDSLQLTPWVLYANKGKAAGGGLEFEDDGSLAADPFVDNGQNNISDGARADVFLAGIGAQWKPLDEVTLSFDGAYGRTVYTGRDESLPDWNNQEGWYVAGKAEYSLDFATPALMAWYASGDNRGKMKNSGQLPVIFGDFDGTSTFFDGAWGIFGGNKCTIGGTWGVSLQLNDISFIDDLTHAVSVTYFSGTNSKWNGGYGDGYDYLTTSDKGVEFNVLTEYNIYKNLTTALELAYIIEDFDTSAAHGRDGSKYDNDWRAALHFKYTF